MKLIITRHGETIQNKNKILQGQTHGKLSDLGLDQAKKLGLRFKDIKIDEIYSSDLNRAYYTAKEIEKYHEHITIKKDKRIREKHLGELQGKPMPKDFSFDNSPSSIETSQELEKRTENFLNEIMQKHTGKTVLVVCHGGTKRSLLKLITDSNKEIYEIIMHNTSVSIFNLKEQKFESETINCTKHLD